MDDSLDVAAVAWEQGRLVLLDQRKLPGAEEYLVIEELGQAVEAIADLVVRGAPAIGITAAYACVLAARQRVEKPGGPWRALLGQDLARLRAARPTAVNLAWAVERMSHLIDQVPAGELEARLLREARQIHQEDLQGNQAMGEFGGRLIDPGSGVLTHCNAGALATGGYGTALGVIRWAWAHQRLDRVYADETRPWLQGARLTAWELARSGIPVTLIADSAAASVMRQGRVSWVVVGADRITANGDVVNKIGTYSLAVLARAHGVGFMVAAPRSTFDLATATGTGVEIESRPGDEIWAATGARSVTPGVTILNSVFDVTPADLVDAIVTEAGVLRPPFPPSIAGLFPG